MKDVLLVVAIFSACMWSSCGADILAPTDPAIQAAEDSALIVNYIDDLGYSDIDSALESGVHYVVLDSGAVDPIDESDIVVFDYIGKLLNDTIFDTSIQRIADSIRTSIEQDTLGTGEATSTQSALLFAFSESKTYQPIEYTYSATGWTLGASGFLVGFTDGVSAALNKLKVGGSALIVLPSGQAYGGRNDIFLIPPNTVIAFELRVVSVESQDQ